MIFEWDDKKDKINQQKHYISFNEVISIFNDKKMCSLYDEMHSINEERWITIGMSFSGMLYVVVHTYRVQNGEEKIRIISARKAINKEIKMYYTGREGLI